MNMENSKTKREEEIKKQNELYGIQNKKKEIKQAVALSYTPGERAPKILATGKGEVAKRIIEKGKEHAIPLYKDEKLTKTLSKLDIGDMIPPQLYDVVAEILVFVDDMDHLKEKLRNS